jgi:uncharacterized membrane-anchored protein
MLAAFAVSASAEPAPSSIEERKEADLSAASAAVDKVLIAGPKDIPLARKAVLHLPANYFFIPQPEAGQFAHALGNSMSSDLVGLVGAPGAGWLVYVTYIGDGHVNDDDAKTWRPEELLQSLKDGTEASNDERVSRGFPALEVAGWIEQPTYDAAAHHLVWSALVKHKNDHAAGGSANYNTYALGRDGHFELDLVTGAENVEAFKANAKEVLASLEFDAGHRYSDFDPSTDHLAAYGLAALVGGVAAKKLGLIALAGAFVAKFAKLIGLAVIGLFAAVRRLFRRRPAEAGAGQDQHL